MTIEARLFSLSIKIASPYREKIFNAVSHYLVFRKIRILKDRLSFLLTEAKAVYDEIVAYFKDRITYDYNVQRLWKALVYCTKRAFTFDVGAKHFRVAEDDLRFLWKHLSLEDVSDLKQLVQSRILLDPIPGREMDWITTELSRHAKHIAGKRLAFISKYDTSMSPEDMADELLVRGLATVRCYDHLVHEKTGTHDVWRILNFARRAVSNYAIDLIKHATDESRARVINTGDAVDRPCSACKATIPGGTMKCLGCGARARTSPFNEFKMTTLSLDTETGGPSGMSLPFYEIIASDEDTHLSVEQAQLFRVLEKRLTSRENAFMRILVGEHSHKFEEWLWTVHLRSADDMEKADLRYYAAKYLEAEEAALTGRLTQVLREEVLSA